MKTTIAAALALSTLAIAAPAHAATGKMAYGEYSKIDPGDSKSSIEVVCNCTGDQSKRDGNLWVTYTADNSTFAADVDFLMVVYYLGADGRWHANSKGRCGPSYAGCRFDW